MVVVSLDVTGLRAPNSSKQILRLRRRVKKLTALLQLALALLRSSGFTLTHDRLPDARVKIRILASGGSGARVCAIARCQWRIASRTAKTPERTRECGDSARPKSGLSPGFRLGREQAWRSIGLVFLHLTAVAGFMMQRWSLIEQSITQRRQFVALARLLKESAGYVCAAELKQAEERLAIPKYAFGSTAHFISSRGLFCSGTCFQNSRHDCAAADGPLISGAALHDSQVGCASMSESTLEGARLTTIGPVRAIRLSDGSLWIRIAADTGADQVQRARPLKGWRTVRELTEELRFCSEGACRTWLARHGVVSVRRGRFVLVDGLDVDRALRSMGRR
jgi:hypothetical protein